jgi:hypothetical protein
MKDKEHVRKDLVEYLSTKVGLDLKALDVDVTKVTFSDDEAHAVVAFHQKNDPSIGSGMVMNYVLTPKDGHWVVKSRADSQGRGFGNTPGGENLPPGHPPVGGAGGGESLPPGHPSLGDGVPPAAGGASQGKAR